jgi:hypothetical protein
MDKIRCAKKQGQNCPFQNTTVRLKSTGESARLRKNWDRDRPKGQICPRAEKEVSRSKEWGVVFALEF